MIDVDDLFQTTPLVPVSEWRHILFKVVWTSTPTGKTETRWCVSTDAHIGNECQRRWPSDFYDHYMEYDMGDAPRPPQVGTIHGCRIDEDGWTYGTRLAGERKLT